MDVIRDYDPDVVIDSFGLLTCLATRVLSVPLVTVLQGNIHPASDGFLWWKKDRPAGLPSAAPLVNKLAAENGVRLVERCADLMAGDLSLILGTPETDPLPASASAQYVGPIVWQRRRQLAGMGDPAQSREAYHMGLLRQSQVWFISHSHRFDRCHSCCHRCSQGCARACRADDWLSGLAR